MEVYSGQPGLSSTGFFDPSKVKLTRLLRTQATLVRHLSSHSDPQCVVQFDWLKPAATSQWLAQKFIALTAEEGAWPIIFSAIAPKDQLQGAETGWGSPCS